MPSPKSLSLQALTENRPPPLPEKAPHSLPPRAKTKEDALEAKAGIEHVQRSTIRPVCTWQEHWSRMTVFRCSPKSSQLFVNRSPEGFQNCWANQVLGEFVSSNQNLPPSAQSPPRPPEDAASSVTERRTPPPQGDAAGPAEGRGVKRDGDDGRRRSKGSKICNNSCCKTVAMHPGRRSHGT